MNLEALHTAEKEVSATNLFKGETGVVTAIQLLHGSKLKEHTTQIPAMLLCVAGKVSYHEHERDPLLLLPGDYVAIPPNVLHWLQAHASSQLVLIK